MGKSFHSSFNLTLCIIVSRDRPHVRIEDFGSDWDRLDKELHSRSGVALLNLHDEYEPHVNFAPSKDGTFFER